MEPKPLQNIEEMGQEGGALLALSDMNLFNSYS